MPTVSWCVCHGCANIASMLGSSGVLSIIFCIENWPTPLEVKNSQESVFCYLREQAMRHHEVRTQSIEHLDENSLRVLNCLQVRRIDQLLSELGPFGELRLIVKNGTLRFIQKLESFDFTEEG